MQEQLRIRINPVSIEDCQLIQDELAAVLATEHFANSKRYPAFLRYVVQKALDGLTEELKERTIGIEVFHRRPDFDSNSDTVVRFTAGEVRRRLALIYLENVSQHKVHIELPVGSYVPNFFRVAEPEKDAAAEATVDEAAAPAVVSDLSKDGSPARWLVWVGVACLVCLSLAYFFRSWVKQEPTSVDRFWQPVRASPVPAIICPGGFVFSAKSLTGMAQADKTDEYPYVSMATTGSIAKLTDMFGRNHMEYKLQPMSSTTLTDMREHPVILLGAYNNDWTLRLVDGLRFRFAPRPAVQIYDATNPSRIWSRPASTPYKDADDFAVVARFRDKLTENIVVVAGGLGKNGTEAAAQFVTSARYLDMLDQQQSKDWTQKNLEVVLKTKVIDGKTGAPSIEAVYVW